MPGTNRSTVPRKPTARSRVSNGNDVLPGVDQRSSAARRYRDITSTLCIDQGGVDHLSEARLQLIRRLSACAVLAEALEARLVAGEKISIEEHAQLVSSMVRLVGKLGIDRRAKEIVPTLEQYLQSKRDVDVEPVGAAE
jgi:hypothetical protein